MKLLILIKPFMASIIIASCLSNSGCIVAAAAAAVAVGAGSVLYIKGDYSRNIDGDLELAEDASVKAIKASGDFIVKKEYGDTTLTIHAETGKTEGVLNQPTAITITLTKLTKKVTKIAIRYGEFGDEARSAQLMEKILSYE